MQIQVVNEDQEFKYVSLISLFRNRLANHSVRISLKIGGWEIKDSTTTSWPCLDHNRQEKVLLITLLEWSDVLGTLLNALFGTQFDVMNEQKRQQTTKGENDLSYVILITKGIWMSKANELGTLVMDVEGTDGRERGEDQVPFTFI